MSAYGEYETIKEIAWSNGATVYSARKNGSDNYIIKVYPLAFFGFAGDDQKKAESFADSFNGRIEVQQKVAAQTPRVTPVLQHGFDNDSAWYVTHFHPNSIQQLIKKRIVLTGEEFYRLINSILLATQEFKKISGRSHGNLKPSNIFLKGEGKSALGQIILSDPAAGDPSHSDECELSDLRSIGEILHRLVINEDREEEYWTLPPPPSLQDWIKIFGKDAEAWHSLCARLLEPDLNLRNYNLAELAFDLDRLKPQPKYSSKKIMVAAAVFAVVAIAGGIIWKKSSASRQESEGQNDLSRQKIEEQNKRLGQEKRQAEQRAAALTKGQQESEAKANALAEERANAQTKAQQAALQKALQEAEAKAKELAEEKRLAEERAASQAKSQQAALQQAETKAKQLAEEKRLAEEKATTQSKAQQAALQKALDEAETKAKQLAEEKRKAEEKAAAVAKAQQEALIKAEARAKQLAVEKTMAEIQAVAEAKAREKAHLQALVAEKIAEDSRRAEEARLAEEANRQTSQAQAKPNPPPVVASVKKSASAGQPWTNSLGMKFVPIGKKKILFAIWETRRKDFERFAKYTSHVGSNWRNTTFKQTNLEPVVNVEASEAKEFCQWLTETEGRDGLIRLNQSYRLPTDAEWTEAANLSQADTRGLIYVWGRTLPPPIGIGNLSPSCSYDRFSFTGPVAQFTPNSMGLYDMIGNVWELCQGTSDRSFIARGGSWQTESPDQLNSQFHLPFLAGEHREDVGFRCVLDLGTSN